MTRLFLLFTLALASAAIILTRAEAAVVSEQPANDVATSAELDPSPEVEEAVRLLTGPKPDIAGALRNLEGGGKLRALPSPHLEICLALIKLRQPHAARFQLEKAVEENPEDPEPYLICGTLALQEGRLAEAGLDFEKTKALLAKYTNANRKAAIERQMLSGQARWAKLREKLKDAKKPEEVGIEKSP